MKKALDVFKGPIAWMSRNPVSSNLLMMIFLVGGILVSMTIKQEVFPEFTLDFVTVSVPYPGASPEEIEKGIILPIEEAVKSVDGVKEITSQAAEGSGFVTVEMVEGHDLQQFSDDIQNEVSRIKAFPEDAEDPTVNVASHKREVLSVALYGSEKTKVLYELAERFRDELIQDKNITVVEISDVPGKEISIEVSQGNLRRYNLTISEIAGIINRYSVELPGGAIKALKGEVLIRVTDRKDYGLEFEKIPVISNKDGTSVLLGEIAEIKDGFEDTQFLTEYNGFPSITLEVYRIGRQTPIKVSRAVKKQLKKFKASLPDGISINILRDMSKIYEQRVDLLRRNGFIGWMLVVLLLSAFLEFKLAFWVAMGVPISFLGAFIILPMFGISINMVSLFAFIISLGIVVDDAIVVGENIFSHIQKGDSLDSSAINGTKEVAMPVVFSILTNIVAFLPLYFVPGVMGKFFKNIPVVVISVFTISLIESIFILPSHLAHDGKANRFLSLINFFHGKQQRFSIWFKKRVANSFGRLLAKILNFRYLFCALGVSIFILTVGFVLSGRIGMTSFMKVEADFSKVKVTLPYGSSIKKTKRVIDLLVLKAKEVVAENGGDELCVGMAANIGVGRDLTGAHTGKVRVYLTDPDVRTISTEKFTSLWRKRVGSIAGIDKIIFESDAGGPGSGGALTVELSHRNTDVLDRACFELADYLHSFPNVKDIDGGDSKGKEQIDFKLKPEGVALGLTSSDIARQLRSAFYGSEVKRQLRGRNEVKIMVRRPAKERESEHYIENFLVKTPQGKDIPLSEIASIKYGRAYTTIKRKELRRIQAVSCDVIPRSKAGVIKTALIKEFMPELVQKYQGLTYSFSGKQKDIQDSNKALGVGMLFALFAIYALLAIPFNNYVQPLIIMVSIPFGVIGAILGHVIMGYPLSILSMFGVVALSGVVVNDSLVLIELANRKFNEGFKLKDAVVFSAINRFRPIMLTTLTTFGGLAPMIFETSMQAKFLIPMAISLGFGILFATIITLVLVPCLYLIVGDLKHLYQ